MPSARVSTAVTDRRPGSEPLQMWVRSTDPRGMKRSLAAVLVAVMFMVGAPAASATEEPPPESVVATTTTTIPPDATATTTPPPATTAITTPPRATTATVAPPPEQPAVPRNQVRRVKVTRDLVFPVVGINHYYAGFGACRDNCVREHHGIDIMTYGWKGVPVVAAHSGTIRTVRRPRVVHRRGGGRRPVVHPLRSPQQ